MLWKKWVSLRFSQKWAQEAKFAVSQTYIGQMHSCY